MAQDDHITQIAEAARQLARAFRVPILTAGLRLVLAARLVNHLGEARKATRPHRRL